jgi:hypothetical protein
VRRFLTESLSAVSRGAILPALIILSVWTADASSQSLQRTSGVGIGDIVARVSADTLMTRVRELCGEKRVTILGMDTLITNRLDGKDSTNNELAGDYLEQQFLRLGLLAGSQRFQDRGRNVLAIQRGVTYPDIKYIICGHYDAATLGFPGADDNASGTAGVLEAARLLSRHSFDYTIEYILWDGEERGLVGSREYARDARLQADSIAGVINLDMIAFDSDSNSRTTLQYNLPIGAPLVTAMQSINTAYALGLDMQPQLTPTTPSDNYSFTQSGFAAFLLIEDFNDFTPHYHKVTDRPATLTIPFFKRMTQAAVGTLALLAGLRAEPQQPLPIAPENGITGVYDPVVLEWTPVEDVDYYRVQLATDASFNNPLLDTDTLHSPSIAVHGLERMRLHYWRVQACGVSGCSRWTEFWSFETALVNAIDALPPVAAARLLTPVPHPFGARARIDFVLPLAAEAEIAVYDLAGRRIALLGAGRYPAGLSSVDFDAGRVPSGLYILRLVTAEGMLHRTVLHLR